MGDAGIKIPIILDFQETFQQFGQSVDSVFAKVVQPHAVHVDAGDATHQLAEAALEAQHLHDTIAKPVAAIVDGAGLQRTAKELAGAFDNTRQSLSKQQSEQKSALAELAASGGRGSDQYKKLLADVEATTAEIKRLDAAEKQVENDLKKDPPSGFFAKLKEGFSSVGGVVAGAFGGTLLAGGLVGVVHGLGQFFDKGKEAVARTEELEIGFRTAGVSAEGLRSALDTNAKATARISDQYAISKRDIEGFTATYLKFGGSVDNLGAKQELIIGLSKRAGIAYDQAAKALAKGTDPEIEGQLTKVGIKFEKNADSAERFRIIQEKLGGTLEQMKEQAAGPIGSLERFHNSLESLQETIGRVLVEAVAPIASVLADVVGPIVSLVGEIFQPLGEILKSVFAPIGSILKAVLLPLIEIVKAVLLPIATVIQSALAPVGSVIAGIFGPIGELFKGIAPLIAKLIPLVLSLSPAFILLKFVAPLLEGIASGLSGILDSVLGTQGPLAELGKIFDEITRTIGDALAPVMSSLQAAFREVGKVIGTIVVVVLKVAIAVVSEVVGWFRNLVLAIQKSSSEGGFFSKVMAGVHAAIQIVQLGIAYLRAVLAGLGAAFTTAGQAAVLFIQSISEFSKERLDQALSKLADIPSAFKNAFSSTLEEARAEIGKTADASVADNSAANDKIVADNKASGERDTASKAKEAKNLSEQLIAITKATTKARDDIERQVIQNQQERDRKALESKYDEQRAAAQQNLRKILDDIAKTPADQPLRVELTDDKGKVTKVLTDRQQIIATFTKATTDQVLALDEEQHQERLALEAKFSLDDIDRKRKQGEDETRVELDINKRKQELLRGQTEEAIRGRLALQERAFQLTASQELQSAIIATDEYKHGVEDIQQKVRDSLLQPGDVQRSVDDLVNRIRTGNEQILLLVQSQSAQLAKIRTDAQFSLDEARIRREATSLAELEFRLKELAARKELQADIDAAGDSEEAKREVKLKYADLEYTSELDFQRKTNTGIAAALAIRENLYRGFFQRIDAERQKSLQRDIDASHTAEAQEFERLQKGEITYLQFSEFTQQEDQKRLTLAAELERNRFDVVRAINDGMAGSFKALGDQYATSATASLTEYTRLTHLTADQMTALGITADEVATETKKSMVDALTDSALQFGSIVGQAAVMGENILKATANTFLDIAAKLLEAQIPVWVASIFGSEVGKLGLAGIATAAIATAGLYGLVSLAKSALVGAKFATGGLVRGGEQQITINERGPEFVANHITTATNIQALTWLNDHPGRTVEDYIVRTHGNLVAAGPAIYPADLERAMANANKPLVEKMEAMELALSTQFENRTSFEHSFTPLEIAGDTLTAHHQRTETVELRVR